MLALQFFFILLLGSSIFTLADDSSESGGDSSDSMGGSSEFGGGGGGSGGVGIGSDTSISLGGGTNGKIDGISDGIYSIIQVNLHLLTGIIMDGDQCLTDLGKKVAFTISATIQDIIDTGVSVPKNIFKHIIYMIPVFFGGDKLRNKIDNFETCVGQNTNAKMVEEGILNTLTCVGDAAFSQPSEKLIVISNAIKTRFDGLPGRLAKIQKAKHLFAFLKETFIFMGSEIKFLIHLAFKGIGLLGVLGTIMGKVPLCFAKNVAWNLVEGISGGVEIGKCAFKS